MSEEPDEHDDDAGGEPSERTATGRKRRSDAGKPRGSAGGRKHVSTRFERRAKKAEQTIRELVELGKPKLDVSGLSFSEVMHRDAEAWGRFLAQIAEWFVPFGSFVDLLFGQPVVILLNVVPSFRAARRDLVKRRERIAAEREEELEDDELRERIAAEHAEHVRRTVEEPPEQELPLGVDPRTAWQRGANGGE